MNKVAYTPTKFSAQNNLQDLLSSLYGAETQFKFFLSEYKLAYDFCVNSTHIDFHPLLLTKADTPVAHVALILDDRLPAGEAFFGFFEVVDDTVIFESLWSELVLLARGHDIKVLKGPVNGSIWHQYRCVKETSGAPYFKTEPMSPAYYYDFLSNVRPNTEITYSSGLRSPYAQLLIDLKKHQAEIEDNLQQNNYEILVVETVTENLLPLLAQISAAAFTDKSWGYTSIDNNEFHDLYNIKKLNEHLYKLFMLYHRDDLVGYCSTMREGNTLICKTICIVPELQGVGLGNAMALRIHSEAEQDGIESIQYVLVRDDNQVHNYPTNDIEVFRRYAVFDYITTS